ncbi:PAS domain-containing protein [Parvibaculum sp.]|uniref:PAS domain-containing protein n=1 Tax=Parvibaculum sp. TaxID=2024848 RepID=UPI003BAD49DA
MGREAEQQRHPAWVRSRLEWSSVEAAKARLSGEAGEVAQFIGDVRLTHLSHEFYAWWLEARGQNIMPGPDNVNPRALVELLPYMRYLSWEADDRLVFRIYGSALEAATGIDLTGTNTFGDDMDYPGRAEDMARLKLLHSHPCGLLLIRELRTPEGMPYLCELITLPVAAGIDGKNRIIGTVMAREQMPESEVDFKLAPPLTLRRAIFFDIGCGVPGVPHLTA